MLVVVYMPAFLRRLRKLPLDVQEQAIQKIALFKDRANHRALNVHKLHGKLADSWAFYVNRKIRIIFKFLPDEHVLMATIDDHSVYRKH